MAARHALDNRTSLPVTTGLDRWSPRDESPGQNSAYGLLAHIFKKGTCSAYAFYFLPLPEYGKHYLWGVIHPKGKNAVAYSPAHNHGAAHGTVCPAVIFWKKALTRRYSAAHHCAQGSLFYFAAWLFQSAPWSAQSLHTPLFLPHDCRSHSIPARAL